jgi:hypothetical protein
MTPLLAEALGAADPQVALGTRIRKNLENLARLAEERSAAT